MIDSTAISALSVLGGSLVGALTSLASTWMIQQHQDRRELLGKRISDREALYASFISEASRIVVDSLANDSSHIDKLIPLYALFARIRLKSSEAVVSAAEQVVTAIIAEYFRPKAISDQAKESSPMLDGRWWADPLADFSRICREELLNLTDSDLPASTKDAAQPEDDAS